MVSRDRTFCGAFSWAGPAHARHEPEPWPRNPGKTPASSIRPRRREVYPGCSVSGRSLWDWPLPGPPLQPRLRRIVESPILSRQGGREAKRPVRGKRRASGERRLGEYDERRPPPGRGGAKFRVQAREPAGRRHPLACKLAGSVHRCRGRWHGLGLFERKRRFVVRAAIAIARRPTTRPAAGIAATVPAPAAAATGKQAEHRNDHG